MLKFQLSFNSFSTRTAYGHCIIIIIFKWPNLVVGMPISGIGDLNMKTS